MVLETSFFFTDTKKNHVFHKHFVLWRGFHTPILFGEFFPYPVLSSQKDVSRVELFSRLFHQKLNHTAEWKKGQFRTVTIMSLQYRYCTGPVHSKQYRYSTGPVDSIKQIALIIYEPPCIQPASSPSPLGLKQN